MYLEGSGSDLTVRYYPSIRLEGLRKTTRIRSTSVNNSTTSFSDRRKEKGNEEESHEERNEEYWNCCSQFPVTRQLSGLNVE
jgi:hypothetical protein